MDNGTGANHHQWWRHGIKPSIQTVAEPGQVCTHLPHACCLRGNWLQPSQSKDFPRSLEDSRHYVQLPDSCTGGLPRSKVERFKERQLPMIDFINFVRWVANGFALIGKPKTGSQINRAIITGLWTDCQVPVTLNFVLTILLLKIFFAK